jgi:hypothetical protein
MRKIMFFAAIVYATNVYAASMPYDGATSDDEFYSELLLKEHTDHTDKYFSIRRKHFKVNSWGEQK